MGGHGSAWGNVGPVRVSGGLRREGGGLRVGWRRRLVGGWVGRYGLGATWAVSGWWDGRYGLGSDRMSGVDGVSLK